MGVSAYLLLLLTHPNEFKTLLQFKLYHSPQRDITSMREHATSGWDRESMRRCWQFLDMTSRSFSAVIKELEGDLARTIALFYLVLRGLDTIEDDMTISDPVKQPLLREFYIHTVTPGWTFTDSGPNEKDRQLLLEYDQVVTEVNLLLPEYKEVIIDIARKMGTGMADYTHKAARDGSIYLQTVEEYDLYCHYVAGLVGEGLSRIFSASKKEVPWLGEQLQLSNSMGLLLQKTNIIRDFREDVDEKRFFWPKEIWGQKALNFSEMKDMYAPHALERATWAQSGMILDALRHACDALDYLRILKNQSVFNFCAIPATMAIATLELCFMNPSMFQRNIKIRKAQAASLIMRSTNPREVAYIFREYTRRLHAKAVPSDPYFLRISIACGKIEGWCETHYPSFVEIKDASGGGLAQAFNPDDKRTTIVTLEQKLDQELAKKRRIEQIRNGIANQPLGTRPDDTKELMMYVALAFLAVFALCGSVVGLVIWLS
ncbi:squalene synthase [Mycena floridula]|nr:squalene synthase [Mycena floridula]